MADVSAAPTARPGRRRQRSVRVTVAVVLLSLATVLVLLALTTGSARWLGVSSVGTVLCGWAAARIVYSELVQSRRDAGADRAAQAQLYQSLFAARAAEHAELSTAMTDRLRRRDHEVADLTSAVARAERRASDAELRVQRESRRVVAAQDTVQELSERVAELEIAQAERADELATWHGEAAGLVDADAVAHLVAWEERATASRGSAQPERRHA